MLKMRWIQGKQNKLSFISPENIWDLSLLRIITKWTDNKKGKSFIGFISTFLQKH